MTEFGNEKPQRTNFAQSELLALKDIELLRARLSHYQKAINDIDDYFEYRMKSKEDQKYVHFVLANLTSNLS